jgi:NADH-quinone oxidoreductase subunit G
LAVITIDGKQYEVEVGKNLLEVCQSEGIDLPYFCWHPSMGSVGACRQCAATQYADADDTRGRLIMGCMTPVADGNIFSIKDEKETGFRASVIEALMTNHPHDCPVCEEGGECHLQDMTEMSGHTFRRYEGKKRTHNNQYLGPLINHEMNRCISCYRCVRFYNDYAGGGDLSAQASHNHVYFGREKDGILESEFAGNLVEVCPTGVFTDKPFSQHFSRKWDLQTAPSVCGHCAVGCNITPGSRYGSIRRVVNRFHSEVNGYFLCDRGRFGYQYSNDSDRPAEATLDNEPLSNEQAVAELAEVRKRILAGDDFVAGVGSPRASLENNFVLREFVGTERFYTGLAEADNEITTAFSRALSSGALDIASVPEIESADAVLILGEDIAETAPRVALALRQTAKNIGVQMAGEVGIAEWDSAAVVRYAGGAKTPIFIASLTSTRIDEISTENLQLNPQRIAELGEIIAERIAGQESGRTLSSGEQRWVDNVVTVLKKAKSPLIISGSGYQLKSLLDSSLKIYQALKKQQSATKYYFSLPESNSLGLGLLTVDDKQKNLLGLLDQLQQAKANKRYTILIVAENDLYRRMEAANVERLLAKVDKLIVLDHNINEFTTKADILLPVSNIFESQSITISAEGRAQTSFAVMPCDTCPSWRWLVEATEASLLDWASSNDIVNAIAANIDALSSLTELIVGPQEKPFARQSHRYSGRTAMSAKLNVAEQRVPQDEDKLFSYSMEGLRAHGQLENSVWAPGWNSNQAIHKFQSESGGSLAGGESGLRLFEYQAGKQLPELSTEPALNNIPADQWLVFPLQHVFTSDELAAKAAAISSLAVTTCLLLNPDDAKKLAVEEWDTLMCCAEDDPHHLYVRIASSIPSGLVGLLSDNNTAMSAQWPRVVDLVKAVQPLPRPAEIIASDGEAHYAR